MTYGLACGGDYSGRGQDARLCNLHLGLLQRPRGVMHLKPGDPSARAAGIEAVAFRGPMLE